MSEVPPPVCAYPSALGRPIVCDMTLPQGPAGAHETANFDPVLVDRARYGVTFTSITIASDELSVGDTVRWIAAARQYFASRAQKLVFVEKVADIRAAHAAGKIAVNLHFQGSNPLGGDLNLVEVYRRLGIGHLLLAYNYRNLAGDGCHEPNDAGLSAFGRELIAEMNRVGMAVDLTHTGTRTALDALAVSTQPVIISHSNSRGVWDHPRNIPDELAKAVAAMGGVIGVNGVGLFLSNARSDISAQAIARHINHYADLVGPDHVGLGLDSVYDVKFYIENFARKNMEKYRTGGYFKGTPQFAQVAVIPQVAGLLLDSGWSVANVKGFLGENWLRVLERIW
jgi:membrane dipeptidase